MTPLPRLLDRELTAQGVDDSALSENDREYAVEVIRSLVTRLKTRTTWESHIGELLSHSEVLRLTGWTKQALSNAVRDGRVIRLEGEGSHAYLLKGFDESSPARPLPGIKKAIAPLLDVDPRGWTAASWLMSPQSELGGRTPRDRLLAGQSEQVAEIAEQVAARLNR